MTKKQFIQAIIVRSLPQQEKLADAVAYAEQLWKDLTPYGYGSEKNSQSSEKKDWYAQLKGKQLSWFKKFWIVFNHKRGRNEAAQAWSELGELNDAEYKFIVQAAEKEAQRELLGQGKIHAATWLNKKRFNDYEPVKPEKNDVKKHLITGLNNQLNSLKTLYKNGHDPALLAQIEQLEQAIRNAR